MHGPGTPVDCTLVHQSTNPYFSEGNEGHLVSDKATRTLSLFNVLKGERITSPEARNWMTLLGDQALKKKLDNHAEMGNSFDQHHLPIEENNTSLSLKFEPSTESLQNMRTHWSRPRASMTKIAQRSNGTWEPKEIPASRIRVDGILSIDADTLNKYIPRADGVQYSGSPMEIKTGLWMSPWATTCTGEDRWEDSTNTTIDWPHTHLKEEKSKSEHTATTTDLPDSGAQSALSVV